MNNDFEPDAYNVEDIPEQKGLIGRLIHFCLTTKLVVILLVAFVVLWGLRVNPFEWDIPFIPRDSVPVDAIPDIGEKQQIVFTEWPGRSPQDVEDQITYPLTSALLGVPGVKTIRSTSMFGFSSIYVIFDESADYYWGRTRVLEKLNSLPAGTLPSAVVPALGPDATGLGQIFWYTLEGRNALGRPASGWDLEELRTIQDWTVRYHLLATSGVAEVAGVGGYVREYQVDLDPAAMKTYKVTLDEVYRAVAASNIDVGAGTIEVNRVEYFLRGLGFVKSLADIENSVVKTNGNAPVLVKHVATVSLGPADRRGALDKEGAEAAGGVVVARYGSNPLAVINGVKEKIVEIAPTLPSKVVIDYSRTTRADVEEFGHAHGFDAFVSDQLNQESWLAHLRGTPRSDWPAWADISQVTIVPFYDRTGLIRETLGTLKTAISQEILITAIVVIIMTMRLGGSVLVSSMMPLAVLLCFVAMKQFGVDANIVALSGIAIAIGTIVDMGIVITENILRHLREAPESMPRLAVVHRAASEVGSAVLTAVATTVVGFMPVFFMTGPEGKLFRPLAFTKTFALGASIIIALTIIPPAAYMFFCGRLKSSFTRRAFYALVAIAGVALAVYQYRLAGAALALTGVYFLISPRLPLRVRSIASYAANIIALIFVAVLLAGYWMPLGLAAGTVKNLIFVALLVGSIMAFFLLFHAFYGHILSWCLRHKLLFLSIPTAVVAVGFLAWLGWDNVLGGLPAAAGKIGISPDRVRAANFYVAGQNAFPGMGKEFMPSLDEGAFLYMPTTMSHASITAALDMLSIQDEAIRAIPEVDSVVGKIGRVDSALDPAPLSMVETVINYKSEYAVDEWGRPLTFKWDDAKAEFAVDEHGGLIDDPDGRPLRQWRDEIKSPDDIWKEIIRVAQVPQSTSAPKLQPIITRIIMLQTGMRAPLGLKVFGSTLEEIEKVGVEIEALLKEVPTVEPSTVFADRIVAKPYIEIRPDRQALERYDVKLEDFQRTLETALGGMRVTTTVEGRRRFPVRIRYQRELRDSIDALPKVLVTASPDVQVPLGQLASIEYSRGPEMIKGENTFLVGYVLFDKKADAAEVDVVEDCKSRLAAALADGTLVLPPGVSYEFAGTYKNQLHATATLRVILPVALFVIFILIYFQFRSVVTTSLVFMSVFVAAGGGFIMLYLYGQGWFLDVSVFGYNLRELFNMHTINLSVAVWVGFLALFGIATDDGLIMGTYLDQTFRNRRPESIDDIRAMTVTAGMRRVRPCLMTTATTVLALLPVLTSSGRGSDIMVPMAIPSFGGMAFEVMTMLVVPVLYSWVKEMQFRAAARAA